MCTVQSWALPIKVPIINGYRTYVFSIELSDSKKFRTFNIGPSTAHGDNRLLIGPYTNYRTKNLSDISFFIFSPCWRPCRCCFSYCCLFMASAVAKFSDVAAVSTTVDVLSARDVPNVSGIPAVAAVTDVAAVPLPMVLVVSYCCQPFC